MSSPQPLPILLIGFNRPDLFRDRLEEIRNLPIKELYISVDSMELGINPEIYKRVNDFISSQPHIRITANFESQNLGLTKHISSAITRTLEKEKAVIVIEDDISLSTYSYEAFNLGHNMQKKMGYTGVVSGFSPLVQPKWCRKNIWRVTTYFSVWGWVATRENWQNYTFTLVGINIHAALEKSISWNKLNRFQKSVWLSRFNRAQLDPLLTWDIQMQFLSFQRDYLNFVPLFRVIENVGFNDLRAAHTKGRRPRWFRISDPNLAVLPENKLLRSINYIGNLIDSITLAGDSKLAHIYTHKIRKSVKQILKLDGKNMPR